jgi:hypothetical protein
MTKLNDPENAELAKYITYDAATGEIHVDENADLDAETGEALDELVADVIELRDAAWEAEDRIADIEDETDEINKRGKEEMLDLRQQVKDALIAERQAEIDELSRINDSIQEAQQNLVDKMQEQIDEARQARDNAKTEQDIADKEARLAYLMMNTSGANDVEIANLQKEIADAKEGYTDTLID